MFVVFAMRNIIFDGYDIADIAMFESLYSLFR